jgi:hypothetical protein
LGLFSLSPNPIGRKKSNDEPVFITVHFTDVKSEELFCEMKRAYSLSSAALVVNSLNAIREQEESKKTGPAEAA